MASIMLILPGLVIGVAGDGPSTTSSPSLAWNFCNIVCSRDYNPVCAQNPVTGEKRTFSNECELRARNCNMKTDFEIVHNHKSCPGEES